SVTQRRSILRKYSGTRKESKTENNKIWITLDFHNFLIIIKVWLINELMPGSSRRENSHGLAGFLTLRQFNRLLPIDITRTGEIKRNSLQFLGRVGNHYTANPPLIPSKQINGWLFTVKFPSVGKPYGARF